MKQIFLLIILVFLGSCSEEPKYDKYDLYKMGIKIEPKLELVIPKDINSGIKCEDYGPGCLSGVSAKVRLVEIVLVEFETVEQAMSEAKRLDQYYVRNWLLDDVKGEPVLETFVVQAFEAKKGIDSSK